jgi:tRNA (guanine-N7-)-methyltransferase
MTTTSSHRYSVPISHPEYKYPSARNPYAKKVGTFQDRIFSDNETEKNRGNWRSFFPDTAASKVTSPRQLHVEIGCNAGHVVVEWAAQNPQNAYIGLDWKWKPIYRGAEKGFKRKLGNLLFFRAHAVRLSQMFAPGEIDRLYLFFPDPWQKKSQLKNRFLTADQLRDVHALLAPSGVFHIKTDHAGYFDWMIAAIEETRELWDVQDLTRDLHAGNPAPQKLTIPEVTLFERLFIQDGLPIHSVRLVRK